MQRRISLLVSMVAALMLSFACSVQGATPTPKSSSTPAAATIAPAAATATKAPAATVAPTKAPAAKATSGGTLRVAGFYDIVTLEPYGRAGWETRTSYWSFDGLTDLDVKSQEIKPMLAESWTISPDGKTYTFKLRKGVKFHDGTDFNADAVMFNVGRWKSFDRIAPDTKYVTGAEKIDDYTVKINMSQPMSSFIIMMSSYAGMMSSPTAVQKWGKDYGRHPVGTGPFEFVELVQADHITYKKFKDYWQKDENGTQLPYLDQIIGKPIPDETVRLINVKTGNLDLIEDVGPKDIAAIKRDSSLVYLKSLSTGFLQHFINYVQEPFDKKACREALEYAIDKEALNKAVFFGEAIVAESVIAPGSWLHDPAVKGRPFDLNKAKDKLKECGKPDGYEFTALVTNRPVDIQRAEAIQAMLKRANINMQTKVLETTTVIAAYREVNFQMAFVFYPGFPDLDRVMEPWYSKSPQYKAWLDKGATPIPGYDEAWLKQEAATTREERKRAYNEAIKAFNDYIAWLPLLHPPKDFVATPKVQNYYPDWDAALHLTRVWLKQ